MTHALRSAAVASLAALAAIAALLAADLTPPVQAQSEDETTGRIVARRLATGRVEFGWQPTGGARVLPKSRYFPAPADATVDRWLRSSPVEVGGVELGRINARLRSDGRIEFAFTPTDGERIAPRQRYFPTSATVARGWLRSTEITIGPPPPRYIAVSARGAHTCGLRSNGALECWGYNIYGETGAPAGVRPEPDPDKNNRRIVYVAGRYTAVSAGSEHTCAIGERRAIVCWGYNYFGQTDAPAGSYTAVSAGNSYTCAIRESGDITCWGYNNYGQTNAPSGNFRAVSAGGYHTCAIRESGEIECWGRDLYGETNAPAGSYTAINAGSEHTCAIRSDGAIQCWGRDLYGETNAPAGSYTSVSAGNYHACAIRESGEITCWGDLYKDWLRNEAGSFTAVSAGRGHTCAIRESGEIECWHHHIPRH